MLPIEENNSPLSTQGDNEEREDQLGGTTNLSLEQLKDEGDINNPEEDLREDATDKDMDIE